MRALIGLIPVVLVLYGTYLFGRMSGHKQALPSRDPLPIIRAAREVVVAEQVGGTSKEIAVQHLEIALDEWDLKRLD